MSFANRFVAVLRAVFSLLVAALGSVLATSAYRDSRLTHPGMFGTSRSAALEAFGLGLLLLYSGFRLAAIWIGRAWNRGQPKAAA